MRTTASSDNNSNYTTISAADWASYSFAIVSTLLINPYRSIRVDTFQIGSAAFDMSGSGASIDESRRRITASGSRVVHRVVLI